MSKKDTSEIIAKSIVNIYKELDSITAKHIELYDKSYKMFTKLALELQDELDNTPKIFKKQRAFLEKQIKEYQDMADDNFKRYVDEAQYLYELNKMFLDNDKKDKGGQ